MNKNSRVILMTLATAAIVLLAGLTDPASAQYLISARGGLVNYTTGPVSFSTSSDPTWRDVPANLQLNEGDRIKTEGRGKAELLLNPGSYLRIGNGAEVVMLSTNLGATSFELLSGSAILEVGNLSDGAAIALQTPVTRVHIKKAGLYRIDVASDAITLTVRHGEASFVKADGTLEKLKKNKRALITANEHQIAKFEPAQADEFDLWSADRAELLVAANQSFIRRMGSWRWPNLLWSAWIYDPFFGCYTFFPWGAGFWSPYGFGFYYPWYPGGYWTGGGYSGGGSGGSGGGPPSAAGKHPFSVRTTLAKERDVFFGRGTNVSTERPSGGLSIHKSGSLGGPADGRYSGGYTGGGVKSGGMSGGHLGGISGGHVGGAKASGGKH